MSNTYFTADPHWSHSNIISYCNRPFKDVTDMNLKMTRYWNERVKPEDTIYVIGDWSFYSANDKGNGQKYKPEWWEQNLNGNKIFIKGNHDERNGLKTKMINCDIYIDNTTIHLVHDPEFARVSYDLNFSGHVHNLWKFKRIKKEWGFTDVVNVGVDVWNFRPVTYSEIKSELYKWRKSQGFDNRP